MALTISDVARLAKVSKTTVSLIINGKSQQGRISSATQRRVLAIVEAQGFVPSRSARSLRSRQTQTIGLVAPDFVNPFFARFNEALEGVARRAGYQILVGCSEDDPQLERRILASLAAHPVDGLVIASVLDERQIRSISRDIPTVYVDREIAAGRTSSVASENRAGSRAAIRRLLEGGVREVAYLGGRRSLSTSRHRLAGYREALAAHGLRPDPRLVLHGDGWTPEIGARLMQELLVRLHRLPQALFTASYTLLEGALRALRDQYGQVPPGLPIATFDDHPLLDFLPNRIIAVRQDTRRLAEETFRMITRALAGHRRAEHRRIATLLVTRGR